MRDFLTPAIASAAGAVATALVSLRAMVVAMAISTDGNSASGCTLLPRVGGFKVEDGRVHAASQQRLLFCYLFGSNSN